MSSHNETPEHLRNRLEEEQYKDNCMELASHAFYNGHKELTHIEGLSLKEFSGITLFLVLFFIVDLLSRID